GRQPHLVALDLRDQRQRDGMVMAPMATLAAVLLRQLDVVAVNAVDGPDMDAIGADDFHVLPDAAGVGHDGSPFANARRAERGRGRLDAPASKNKRGGNVPPHPGFAAVVVPQEAASS